MDNLIYRREIPVMIGVFINPGRTAGPAGTEPAASWGDRTTNRATEYNTPDDKYARMITEELMPALYKDYNISKDPEQRGIGGASSGAIAAFTVAWERPNEFRKVFSDRRQLHRSSRRVCLSGTGSGEREEADSDVSLRRPQRQPRVREGRGYDEKRDWFYQNVRLEKALEKKGYDVNYRWGMNLTGRSTAA